MQVVETEMSRAFRDRKVSSWGTTVLIKPAEEAADVEAHRRRSHRHVVTNGNIRDRLQKTDYFWRGLHYAETSVVRMYMFHIPMLK